LAKPLIDTSFGSKIAPKTAGPCHNRLMRKNIIKTAHARPPAKPQGDWLDLEHIASVEVSSEDPEFPVESALGAREGPGWRAAEPGEQTIRLIFDKPQRLQRTRLEFLEENIGRTQEFVLRWSRAGESSREIVRQQWNFSPQGATTEVEDYTVNLDGVSMLELSIKPEIGRSDARATLASWRIA
jgi:hypothetical protein